MPLSAVTTSRVSGVRAVGLVGLCIIASGLLVNGYLAVVAHNVSVADYANFGAYWSLALVVGFGVFLPIEQELARLLSSTQVDHRAVLRAAMLTASLFAVAELVILLAASRLLIHTFERTGTLAALGAMCLVCAGQFVVRGSLIGTGRMGRYGGVLVLDAAVRVALAVAVALVASTDSAGYAWVLVAAIALTHLPLLLVMARRAERHTGEPVSARSFALAVAPLLAGSLAAQVLLNGVPVLVSAVATADEQVAAGRFQAAFLLARIPLFVAVPLQTAILPELRRLLPGASPSSQEEITADRAHLAARVIVRFAGAVLGVAALGAAAAYTIGPFLVGLVFGGQYVMPRFDLAAMIVGVTAHLALIIVTQALVASALHAKVAWSWLAGLAVAAAVFAAVPDLALRGELAFLSGSAVGCAVGLAHLGARYSRPSAAEGGS